MGRGICEAFAPARRIFDLAEEATKLPLKKLCFEGPEDELSRTDIAQPAIFTVSAATLAAMEELFANKQPQLLRPEYAAGLSLGEYTALFAAGAMDFETGVKLVARRGELMQQAALAKPSGMVSVMGLDETRARELCDAASDGQVLTCANFNCPGQIVLSGEIDATRRAAEMAQQFGATGAVPLKVAGAFHSEIMTPAAEAFGETLDGVEFSSLKTEVLANVSGGPYSDVSEIKDKLLSQLVSSVRWEDCMKYLLTQGVEKFYEIGPGRVLSGLLRRIDRKMRAINVNSSEGLEKLADNA
jgi:[acyl-carrier-protein] S-malonyltransferase